MGVKERREKARLIKKNNIIDAAERVFATKSVDEATMDDIAKEAEFSKRTIYLYFESKKQLYFEIALRAFKKLNKFMAEAAQKQNSDDGLALSKQLMEIYIEFNKRNPLYFMAVIDYTNEEGDFAIQNDTVNELFKESVDSFSCLIDALQKGIDDGSIRGDMDTTNLAVIVWTGLVGFYSITMKKEKYFNHYFNIDREYLMDEAIEFIISSIEAR